MHSPNILLVDDERLILGTLGQGLGQAGYQVKEAASGAAALALAEQHKFDLALLDIRMPSMSGIELARRLRDGFDIPSLFLSAFSDQRMVEEAVKEGGLGYLVKPVDIPQLVPAIEAALARARDLRDLQETKGQLEQALSGGRNTSLAVGILMERRGLTQQDAFETLRGHARAQGCRIEVLAGSLVEAENTLNSLKGQA